MYAERINWLQGVRGEGLSKMIPSLLFYAELAIMDGLD